RDEAGRVIATTNSDGKSRHFTYNARGAITTFTNERGEQKRYEYDRRGRLKTIYQSNGKRTTIERDERGRPQRISLSTGDRLIYKYDRSGHVASIKREPSATKLTKTDFNPAKLVGANAFAQDQKDRPQTNLACSPEGPFEVFCGSIIDQPAEGQFGDFFFGDSWGGFGGFFFIYDGFYDPFFWSFNPFFSFGGESCGECISRQDQICETARSACNLKVGAEFGTSLIACAGISAVTGLIGLSVCGAVALGAETLGLLACNNDFDACNLAVLDKCPQCRN
ncbi:MAG: RHS repeat domain-containing protein, partial [Pyrinomonadaceae bacterium]